MFKMLMNSRHFSTVKKASQMTLNLKDSMSLNAAEVLLKCPGSSEF